MRTLKRNKQKLYYALYVEDVPIYAYDEEGNILTTEVDGVTVYVVDSYKSGYSAPVEFEANISFDSGETRLGEYGLNTSDYNAVISADKGELPFNEQTLIWHTSEPKIDIQTGEALPESADYKITAIKTSLNEERFILKKTVNGGTRIVPPSK